VVPLIGYSPDFGIANPSQAFKKKTTPPSLNRVRCRWFSYFISDPFIDQSSRLCNPILDRMAKCPNEPCPESGYLARLASIEPDDLYTLIYTSGTSGTSNGVMRTHQNILAAPGKTEKVERLALLAAIA
jgi:acyl-CoA synthetase (AMP-forming)/AMP-acid ligase II